MKKIILSLILVCALMITTVGSAFAAGPVEYTIDVRNRTGQPVELNYTGADLVIHTVTIPTGVSSLTLFEDVYSYWADPQCGHIAGTFNISQQSVILWLQCDQNKPALKITKATGPTSITPIYESCKYISEYGYNVYDWDYEYTAWESYGYFCFDEPAVAGDGYEASVWYDGVTYWYVYYPLGLPGDEQCEEWINPGEGFYYTYKDGSNIYHCPYYY